MLNQQIERKSKVNVVKENDYGSEYFQGLGRNHSTAFINNESKSRQV